MLNPQSFSQNYRASGPKSNEAIQDASIKIATGTERTPEPSTMYPPEPGKASMTPTLVKLQPGGDQGGSNLAAMLAAGPRGPSRSASTVARKTAGV